ncbi:hypothetical protein LIER_01309 [Lithospermum erythrorhizon]|uniref:DUF4283 domain-containing protein n=1 Tax=Lithospermum erythrorhizon TaxID=34254 RepID=A0AAV3NKH9_LITER
MGFNLFHFIFNDETQMIRVLQGEPWLFEGYSILLGPWKVGMPVDQISLTTIPYWVQIWNLPLGFVDVEMSRVVGAHVGTVLDVDKRNVEQGGGRYVRVKIGLDIGKPFKRGSFVLMRTGKVQLLYRYAKLCDVVYIMVFLDMNIIIVKTNLMMKPRRSQETTNMTHGS